MGPAFFTYSDRARPVLLDGTVHFGSLASTPARPLPREGFHSIFGGERASLGPEFSTYSERARRVLLHGTVHFGSLASTPARPLFQKGFHSIFTGGKEVPWDPQFLTF